MVIVLISFHYRSGSGLKEYLLQKTAGFYGLSFHWYLCESYLKDSQSYQDLPTGIVNVCTENIKPLISIFLMIFPEYFR